MSAWEWPQWVIAGWLSLAVVTHISMHGKNRGEYSGPGAAILVAGLSFALWSGGFWK